MQANLGFDHQSWRRFVSSLKLFAFTKGSAERGKALWLFVGLISLMLGINGLNVLNSYVGRDFMTSIENRNFLEFIKQALLYIGVFAGTTIVAVYYRFTEETLGVLWRESATKRCLVAYTNHRIYYRLKQTGEVGNPDQRISEDVRTYTASTLSFLLMVCNGTLTAISFSGVLWSISPMLFVVSVVYAASGTWMTFLLGKPLIGLNYDQLDKEADFRAALTSLRANAESVAISRREAGLLQLTLNKLSGLLLNFRRIIAINRNVNFFTTGYNWMIQIIPALIVAPLFIEGKVEFGVITQSAMAFSQLIGAFSLIITQFQSISSYTAVAARLVALIEAGTKEKEIDIRETACTENENLIAYSGLTLHSHRSGRLLIRDLNFKIPRGCNALVQSPDETARTALAHATAGLWSISGGAVTRPKLHNVLLLPELPYLPPGTLRELLMLPWPEESFPYERKLEACNVADDRIAEVTGRLKLEHIVKNFGIDKRHHWENDLPLADQKLLIIARVLLARPAFVFLDRPGTSLSEQQLDWIFALLRADGVTYATFEERGGNLNHYNVLLEIEQGGAWSSSPIRDGNVESGQGARIPVMSDNFDGEMN